MATDLRDRLPARGVSLLIPYRADHGPRDVIWKHVARRLMAATAHIDPELIMWGDGDARPDLFSHATAINECARRARSDVYAICDADTTFLNPGAFLQAIADCRADGRWRLSARYYYLSEEATRSRLQQGDIARKPKTAEIEWEGLSWSGIVIVPAEAFWKIGGADERYIGWGGDDVAFGTALDALYGEHVRYPDPVVHLWHPRGDQEKGWHEHSVAHRELTERYGAAAGDASAIAAIVADKPRVARYL